MLISAKDYAALHGVDSVTVRQRCARGAYQTAVKIGRDWLIDRDEPHIDHRYVPAKDTRKEPRP